MNIKRCDKCGKPLRADATYCKACGHNLGGESSIHRASTSTHPARRRERDSSPTTGAINRAPTNSNAPSRSRNTRHTGTRPTIPAAHQSTPPASPHRAGHYSGLHPEDQPYQSSFMVALRPPTPAVLSPSPLTYPLERVLAPANPNATWAPKTEMQAPEHLYREEDVEEDEPMTPTSPLPTSSPPNDIWMPESERVRAGNAALARIDTPSVPQREEREPEPLAFPQPKRNVQLVPTFPSDPDRPTVAGFVHRTPRMGERALPLLLTVFCLCCLVATSLLAYVFLNRHASDISPTHGRATDRRGPAGVHLPLR
jgi:hypothetical protein